MLMMFIKRPAVMLTLLGSGRGGGGGVGVDSHDAR